MVESTVERLLVFIVARKHKSFVRKGKKSPCLLQDSASCCFLFSFVAELKSVYFGQISTTRCCHCCKPQRRRQEVFGGWRRYMFFTDLSPEQTYSPVIFTKHFPHFVTESHLLSCWHGQNVHFQINLTQGLNFVNSALCNNV